MPTSLTITMGTWNLQKGPALQDLAKTNLFACAALSARHQILNFLTSHCDITFVQEAPSDIRDASQQISYDDGPYETHEQTWISYNKEADNQVHKSANRPAFWCRSTVLPVMTPSDCPANGKEDSYRLSAMGWAVTTVGEALFISLHATSGYNAKRNTEDFLTWLAEWVPKEHPKVGFVLIGADFNHHCAPEFKVGGVTAKFKQPNQMTQQSGSILDGFCCIVFNPLIQLKWYAAERVCTGELAGPIPTTMVQVNPNIGQLENQRGYIGVLPPGPLPGTNKTIKNSMPIRMSDHCAVVAKLELTCP